MIKIISKTLELSALAFITLYRLCFSPIMAPRCRFKPSCSEYFFEAIKLHGFLLGIKLSTTRLLRCNPWSSSGLDPVPTKSTHD